MRIRNFIFTQSVLGFTFLIIMGFFLMYRADISKEKCTKVSGKVTKLSIPKENYRELQIDNNAQIFRLFVGKGEWDFKAKYEIVDSLQAGDSIDIYYKKNFWQFEFETINRLTAYIYKGEKPIYLSGDGDKKIGIGVIALAVVCLLITFILKRLGKI